VRLKAATTILFALGLIGVAALPVLLARGPGTGAGRQALAEFGARMTVYFGLLCLVWLAVAVLGLLIVRRERLRFRAEKEANLQELIEGTLKDHAKRRSRKEGDGAGPPLDGSGD
jgi:Flp pilus assembly protein protease CpaA